MLLNRFKILSGYPEHLVEFEPSIYFDNEAWDRGNLGRDARVLPSIGFKDIFQLRRMGLSPHSDIILTQSPPCTLSYSR
jgi:hypothetical protein